MVLIHTNDSKKVYEINVDGAQEKNLVSYKLENGISKIGLLNRRLQTYYKIEDKPFCEKFTNALKEIDIKKISSKIDDLNINRLLDPNTCKNQDPIKLEILKNGLSEGLNPKTSAIIKCFNNKNLQQVLFKDPFLQIYATKAIGRYLEITDNIKNGSDTLKIKCELPDIAGNKIASFNEQSSPKELQFQLKNQNFSKSFGTGRFDDSLNHELLHYADQQTDTKADEVTIKHFECLCNNTMREKIADNCNESEKNLLAVKHAVGRTKAGGATAQASLANTNRETLEQKRVAVAENLTKIDEPTVFAPVSNAAIDNLASSELLTTSGARLTANDGEQKNVVLNPEQKKYLDEVYTKLSGTVEGVTKAINKPVALIAQKAQANNFPSATTQPEALKGQIATYSPSEILADKYGIPYQNVSPTTTLSSKPVTKEVDFQETNLSANTEPSTSPVSRSPAAVSRKTQQNKGETETTKEIVSNTNPTSIRNNKNVPTQNSNSNETSTSRSVASVQPSQQKIQPAVDNTVLQTLSALNVITGSHAKAIRNRYNDPKFPDELAARGYSITVIQNGKRSVLGPQNSQVNFIDDGKNLVKVQKAK